MPAHPFSIAFALAVLTASAPLAAATLSVEVDAKQRPLEAVEVSVAVVGAEGDAQVVTAPGVVTFTLDAGSYTVAASAPGFDSASVPVSVDGDASVALTLFPAGDSVLSGTVHTWEDAPAAGARVRLSGPRTDVAQSTTTGADGTYAFPAVPAGFYDLEVQFDGAATVRRDGVDLLGDATLDVRLADLSERPAVDETRSLCASAPVSSGWLVGLMAMMIWRRRS